LHMSSHDSIGRVQGARWLPVAGGRIGAAACRPGRVVRWWRDRCGTGAVGATRGR
jgi:hypothetical protein